MGVGYSPQYIYLVLLIQLFPNCAQMYVITYNQPINL